MILMNLIYISEAQEITAQSLVRQPKLFRLLNLLCDLAINA